jgi:hypothetical protein
MSTDVTVMDQMVAQNVGDGSQYARLLKVATTHEEGPRASVSVSHSGARDKCPEKPVPESIRSQTVREELAEAGVEDYFVRERAEHSRYGQDQCSVSDAGGRPAPP